MDENSAKGEADELARIRDNIEVVKACIGTALEGYRQDSSWIRPMRLSMEERAKEYQAAAAYLDDALTACNNLARRPSAESAKGMSVIDDEGNGYQGRYLAAKARAEAAEAELAKLQDSTAVWVNILQGKIARPQALDHYEECKAAVERLEAELAALKANGVGRVPGALSALVSILEKSASLNVDQTERAMVLAQESVQEIIDSRHALSAEPAKELAAMGNLRHELGMAGIFAPEHPARIAYEEIEAELAALKASGAKRWRLDLTCCGRSNGVEYFETWEKADAFRESYTSGVAVAEHGYSAKEYEEGHRRAGIIIDTFAKPAPSAEPLMSTS
jgi:DNA repair exonuclease SbcCD ATPase subunit